MKIISSPLLFDLNFSVSNFRYPILNYLITSLVKQSNGQNHSKDLFFLEKGMKGTELVPFSIRFLFISLIL